MQVRPNQEATLGIPQCSEGSTRRTIKLEGEVASVCCPSSWAEGSWLGGVVSDESSWKTRTIRPVTESSAIPFPGESFPLWEINMGWMNGNSQEGVITVRRGLKTWYNYSYDKIIKYEIKTHHLKSLNVVCIFEYHPGPNFIELLSTNIFLAWHFQWYKQDNHPNFYLLHIACYWYSAFVCLSWKSCGNLVGNPIFTKEEMSRCLANFGACMAALWNWVPFSRVARPMSLFETMDWALGICINWVHRFPCHFC